MDSEGASLSSTSSPSTSSDEQLNEHFDDEEEGGEKPETLSNGDFDSDFGEISSTEFASASYISFGEPVFTSSILVNQPNCYYDPEVMALSQNCELFSWECFATAMSKKWEGVLWFLFFFCPSQKLQHEIKS